MSYEHLLVAVDLTEECDPVIKRAMKLAEPTGAKVSLVHIVEPMAMAFGGDVPMDLSQLQQQQFDQAKERMDRLFNKYPTINRGDSHLTYGQPRQEIHQLAKDQNCDLIVVGSHGRHGLALLLGSTANDVLHGAPCDVLAVRLQKRRLNAPRGIQQPLAGFTSLVLGWRSLRQGARRPDGLRQPYPSSSAQRSTSVSSSLCICSSLASTAEVSPIGR